VGIHIAREYHVDLQAVFKTTEKGDRAGMGALAAAIIDDSDKDMKDKCMDAMHEQWHLPLSLEHLRYTTIHAYVSYEMYKRILQMKEGLGLGHPVQNDKLCVRCMSGEDHKSYKRLKQNLNTSDEQVGAGGRRHPWRLGQLVMNRNKLDNLCLCQYIYSIYV
jgi:hypothetical protein